MKLSDQELSGLFIPCPSKLVTHHTSAQDTREQSRAYAGPGSAGDSSNSVGWEGGSVLLIGPPGLMVQGHTGASLLHITPLISSTLLDSPNKDIFDLICRNKNIQRDKLVV